jgi:chemotaxis protein MotB
MARKKHEVHEEHENHERWLVSYADFITLLFAFFVVMYASTKADSSKYQAELAKSVKIALFNPTGPKPMKGGKTQAAAESDDAVRQAALKEALEKLKKSLEQQLSRLLKNEPNPPVKVVFDGKRLSIRLQAARFFNAGEAELKPDILPMLDAVGREMFALNRPIRVEGHTDDQKPGGGSRFRSNWELSAARAVTVTEFLIDGHHLTPSLLTAAGLSDTRPVEPNGTEEGREANRRIELVLAVIAEDPLDTAVR